jgi:hypothetical protein
MATAPKIPPDEALEILRRLEPALGRIDDRLRNVEVEAADLKVQVGGLDNRMRSLEIDFAEMKGRLTGIESQIRQLPTLWTLAGLVVAIFGFAAPH